MSRSLDKDSDTCDGPFFIALFSFFFLGLETGYSSVFLHCLLLARVGASKVLTVPVG